MKCLARSLLFPVRVPSDLWHQAPKVAGSDHDFAEHSLRNYFGRTRGIQKEVMSLGTLVEHDGWRSGSGRISSRPPARRGSAARASGDRQAGHGPYRDQMKDGPFPMFASKHGGKFMQEVGEHAACSTPCRSQRSRCRHTCCRIESFRRALIRIRVRKTIPVRDKPIRCGREKK
jgi:hypothetical protein